MKTGQWPGPAAHSWPQRRLQGVGPLPYGQGDDLTGNSVTLITKTCVRLEAHLRAIQAECFGVWLTPQGYVIPVASCTQIATSPGLIQGAFHVSVEEGASYCSHQDCS